LGGFLSSSTFNNAVGGIFKSISIKVIEFKIPLTYLIYARNVSEFGIEIYILQWIQELALTNDENRTKFDMINEENNAILIASSINLTDKVKNIFEDLVIENFRHQDYQSNCFEKLIKVWLGEKFLATSLQSLDIEKEMERFDNDVKIM